MRKCTFGSWTGQSVRGRECRNARLTGPMVLALRRCWPKWMRLASIAQLSCPPTRLTSTYSECLDHVRWSLDFLSADDKEWILGKSLAEALNWPEDGRATPSQGAMTGRVRAEPN